MHAIWGDTQFESLRYGSRGQAKPGKEEEATSADRRDREDPRDERSNRKTRGKVKARQEEGWVLEERSEGEFSTCPVPEENAMSIMYI